MGKGDKKTAKGKRVMGSYGVTRKKKTAAPVVVEAKPKKVAADVASPKEVTAKKAAPKKVAEKKETKVKAEAPKKVVAKKTTKKEA